MTIKVKATMTDIKSQPKILSAFFLCLILGMAQSLPAEEKCISAAAEFSDLSIEQLMAIPVTSVSRRQEQLLNTASAVYVITQEEI